MVNDAGTGFVDPGIVPGSSATVQNSQCQLAGTGASVNGSGNSLTLAVPLTFLPAFTGQKNVYMFTDEYPSSVPSVGFTLMGTWTGSPANSNQPPSAISMTPNVGTGLSQTFAFVSSDQNGASYITGEVVLFGAGLSASNNCFVWYQSAQNVVYLFDDSGTNLLGGLQLGQPGTIANSQCSLNTAGSAASSSGNLLTLNLALTFTAAFAGTKNAYLNVGDQSGQASGYQTMGTWTAGSNVAGFTMSAVTDQQNIQAGGAGSLFVETVNFNGGFTGPVTLTMSGLPAGVTMTQSATTMSGSSGTNSLTGITQITLLSSPAAIPTSTATTVTLTGTGGGNTQSIPVTMMVMPLADPASFTLSAPQSGSVKAGQQLSFIIGADPVNGAFSSPVTLSNLGWPTGFSGTFQPASIAVPGSSVVTVTTTTQATSADLPILGTAQNGANALTYLMLNVMNTTPPPNFTLSAPMTKQIAFGGSTTFTASAMGNNGFSGNVSLSVTGLSDGLGATIGRPLSVPANGSDSTSITINALNAAAKTYPLQIVGTPNVGQSQTVAITVTVGSGSTGTGDFMLSAVAPVTVQTGTPAPPFPLGLTPLGNFSGGVTFTSDFGGASGFAVSFSPNTVGAVPGSTMVLVSAGQAATGNYTLTITGSGSGRTHMVVVPVKVISGAVPMISLSHPPSQMTPAGNSITFTDTATNPGQSQVTYAFVTPMPRNITASFTSTGVNTATATVNVPAGTPDGTYTLMFSAKDVNGDPSNTEFFTVTVGANSSFSIGPVAPVTIARGGRTTVAVNIVPGGAFNSPVSFSYDPSTWPSFVAGTFSPFTVSPGNWSTGLTISVLDSAQLGTYNLPIAADGNGHAAGTITLTVTPGNAPLSCTAQAIGISEITYHPDAGTVETYSATELNYCGSIFYDAYIEASLYRSDSADPRKHGTVKDNPLAEGTLSEVAFGGYDYELKTDHYVVAYFAFYYDVYGSSIFQDPFGFGFISGSSSVGSTEYLPSSVGEYVLAEYLYLGTTAVSIPTADQSPVITSITPDSMEAGSSVPVTIAGSGFGINPTVEFSGDGLVTVIVDTSSSTDTRINGTLVIDPNATPGDRAVDVLSNGSAGNGFQPSPGRSARSNPVTFNVRGSPCTVTIANAGQKYSLGADYLTTVIPLRAESSCSGTVIWTITFHYETSGKKGASNAGPFQISDTLKLPSDSSALNYRTPLGAGGRVDVTAGIRIDNVTTNRGFSFFVDGVAIPADVVTSRLVMLYQGGGNPRLLTGLAKQESGNYQQFGQINGNISSLFGQQGLWPNESYDGGSHIGLMMVPVNMVDAYNWEQNTMDGRDLFANEKLRFAGNYEAALRMRFPRLRSLTLQETELDALVFYGPASVNVADACTGCRTGKIGAYWIPNAAGTDWVVNSPELLAVRYVKNVLQKIQ